MRRVFLVICSLAFALSGSSQEIQNQCQNQNQRPSRRGDCAGYSSRDATNLSMMGWGLGLGIGIATLCALIPNNEASNGHSH